MGKNLSFCLITYITNLISAWQLLSPGQAATEKKGGNRTFWGLSGAVEILSDETLRHVTVEELVEGVDIWEHACDIASFKG